MSILPIVERELRVRARLKSTYRFRLAGAGIAIFIVGFMLVVSGGMTSPDKFGATIFQVLGWLTFIFCLLEGTRNTADCLSEEKRAGTLGLLFLTDLKGYDVVLGKMMATSLNSFYALLAVLPLLALPLLLGGVTAGEFWRLTFLLVNTLFLSLTVGLFVSAVSREERRAWSSAMGLILLLTFYPLLSEWCFFLPGAPWVFLGPTLAFGSFGDVAYRQEAWTYWACTLCMLGLSWGLLGLACWILPRAWQERVVAEAQIGRWRVFPWLAAAQARRRRWHASKYNPVIWLAERQHRQQVVLWILVLTACVAGLSFYHTNSGSRQAGETLFWCGLALHFVIALWAGAQASFVFGEARRTGALELLLATPLTVKEVIQGHFLALRNQFFAPVMILVMTELGLLLAFVVRLVASGKDMFECALAFGVAGFAIVLFILDLFAVGWFGLWMGLVSKKPAQAVTKTLLFVMVLPLVCGSPCNVLWPVVGMVKDLIFMNYAQDQINRRFRSVVTERFTARLETEPWVSPAGPPAPPRLPSVLD